MNLKDTKPAHFPDVYASADKFFSKISPSLDYILSPYKRIMTLNQTIGTGFNAFHPLLLDYPSITELLRGKKYVEESDWHEFWVRLESKSVIHHFRAAKPLLDEDFDKYRIALPNKSKPLKAECEMQAIALNSITAHAPHHIEPEIFLGAFDCKAPFGRQERITQMQAGCIDLQIDMGIADNQLIDFYNLTVLHNGYAYNAYKQIQGLLNEAYEHALRRITITVPHDRWPYIKWKDITRWYAARETVRHTAYNIFKSDHEALRFYIGVFHLRDSELKRDAVKIKQTLLRHFAHHRGKALQQLCKTMQKYPFAAPGWVKTYFANQQTRTK